MSVEQTLGIIKPDGVARDLVGEILLRVERADLTIIGLKMLHLNKAKAEGFYQVHKDRPFFASLVKFMTSGSIVVFAVQGENAIAKWRALMGATNPEQAEVGTIRRDFAEDIEKNTVHGSDSPATAKVEVSYFFDAKELRSRPTK